MTKITLPPCEFWPGATACCAAEFVEGGEMGLCKYLREQAKCEYYKPEGGFDALAAAVVEAGCDYDVCHIQLDTDTLTHEAIIEDKDGGIWIVRGPTPTAALVAAVNKANS